MEVHRGMLDHTFCNPDVVDISQLVQPFEAYSGSCLAYSAGFTVQNAKPTLNVIAFTLGAYSGQRHSNT
jgi:hypothetical protein